MLVLLRGYLQYCLSFYLNEQNQCQRTHEYADIGFVHSDKNSDNIAGSRATAPTFLRNFKSKNEGILVATSQLIGEGYDDPAIDSVFVTYASTSISHLMQVAGRALRRSEGKTEAKIIQVQTTKLEYYFSQKWLYHDTAIFG